MTNGDELNINERMTLLGWLNGSKVEDYDEQLVTALQETDIMYFMDIPQSKRRALLVYITSMFKERFGEEMDKEAWMDVMSMAMEAFLEGYKYRDNGNEL